MTRPFLLLIISFALTNCDTRINSDNQFKDTLNLKNLANKDTLFIDACIHNHCGGEWGGCLESNKIYRQENNYFVVFTNGMTVWNGDTIIDPKKTKSITKTLTKSDIKYHY
jgi:hypothetical protein